MNRVYVLIWHWIVTVGLLAFTQAIAAPAGGQISAGQGSIGQSGATTMITQDSPRLAINWQGFNVGANETVNFVQPDRNAIALNRVLGTDGTRILGNINSNGQVFILNPNGVLFGAGAQVNVGGLIASTLNLSDADFMAGNHVFDKTGGGNGTVVNQGQLIAEDGGYIALIGPHVRNEGLVSARLGTALLAAGDKVTLNLNNGSLLGYSIDKGSLDALAENAQLIRADGGQVLMSAEAADALARAVVNNTGVIEARTLQNIEGRIMLMGDMQVGQVNVGGTLDASAPNGGNGGFIETSAAHVHIADGVRVTTAAPQGAAGAWMIDPVDFRIAASGGDITGATLSAALMGSNVVIQSTDGAAGTAGDINVNDVVSWSANDLRLVAEHNINVNADLNASGTAGLALEWGQVSPQAGNNSELIIKNAKINLPSTGTFSTKFGSDGVVKNYTIITTLGAAGSATGTDLQGIVADTTLNYALGANIDASATAAWNVGAGFDPINNFSGTFDGLGHSITNLNIDRPGQDYVGLFGYTVGASLLNLNLVNAQVTGRHQTGALVGGTTLGTVNRVNVSGQVNGGDSVGGLIGYDNTTSVGNSSSSVDVSGDNYVGGLLGSTGGGVATGGNYATGSVTGTGNFVGGLIGFNGFAFVVTDSYATGPVTGSGFVGGLVGYHWNGAIVNSYSTGSVTGMTDVGGLVGFDAGGGFIGDSFWNTQTSGQATSVGGTGLTTAQMQSQASFTGFDFTNNWVIYEGHSTPLLRGFLTPLTVTANDATKVVDGLPYSGGNGVAYSSTPNGNLLGTVSYSGTSQGATDVGTYVITPGDLYSNQQGYLISFVDGALNVTAPVAPPPNGPVNPGVAAYTGALQSLWQLNELAQSDDASSSNPKLLSIVNCGVRMPQGFAADACLTDQPSER